MTANHGRGPRFGVILHPYSVTFDQILKASIEAEKLGFDSLWVPDHLQRENLSTVECWSTISALSAWTKRIRIGSLATCNSFRSPSLLARIVATVSDISGGRTDIAIGLGYDENEHVANGFPFPSFKHRVSMLSESLRVLKSLWSSDSSDFNGSYYKLSHSVSNPKPKGNLRLWVAGRNMEVLKLAAQYAYGVNILPYSGVLERRRLSSFEELQFLCNRIDSFPREGGRLAKSMYCGDGGLVVGRDREDYTKQIRQYALSFGLPESGALERVQNLSLIHGTVEECRNLIQSVRLLGLEELMIYFPGWQSGDYSNMQLFAEEFIS